MRSLSFSMVAKHNPPSIVYSLPREVTRGSKSSPSWHSARAGWDTPWIACQACLKGNIKRQTAIHTHIRTYGQFRVSNKLTPASLWTVGGRQTHANPGRTCKLQIGRTRSCWDSNREAITQLWGNSANILTTSKHNHRRFNHAVVVGTDINGVTLNVT